VVAARAPAIVLKGDNPVILECCADDYQEPGATVTDVCDPDPTFEISGEATLCTPGQYEITYTAADENGNTSTAIRTVEVQDTTPPVIVLPQEPVTLWPANHKRHELDLSDIVSRAEDTCDGSVSAASVNITSISCDEPEDAAGDGHTGEDIVIGPDCRSVALSAERQGGGNGRVYTINLALADASGNIATASYQVLVPHDKKKKTSVIDDGPAYVAISACSAIYADGPAAKPGVPVQVEPGNPVLSPHVADQPTLPAGYALHRNTPNPFNPSTQIAYQIPKSGSISLTVYTLQGQQIRVLEQGYRDAGSHRLTWDGRDDNGRMVSSGVYLYRFVSKGLVQTNRMLLLK